MPHNKCKIRSSVWLRGIIYGECHVYHSIWALCSSFHVLASLFFPSSSLLMFPYWSLISLSILFSFPHSGCLSLFMTQFMSEEENRQKQEFKTLQENQEIQLKELQDQCNFNITELNQLQVQQCILICLHSFRITSAEMLLVWKR